MTADRFIDSRTLPVLRYSLGDSVVTVIGGIPPVGVVDWSRSAIIALDAAYLAWRALSGTEGVGSDIARLWIVGNNPVLGEVPPCVALHDGLVREVLDAADIFIRGEWVA